MVETDELISKLLKWILLLEMNIVTWQGNGLSQFLKWFNFGKVNFLFYIDNCS